MREGLLFCGMMAAVGVTAAIVSATSPNLFNTDDTTHDPGVVNLPQIVPPPTLPASTPPVSVPVPVPPASPSELPRPSTLVPLPKESASPRGPIGKSVPAPTNVPKISGEGEPPSLGEPCPIGLALDPTLSICVVI